MVDFNQLKEFVTTGLEDFLVVFAIILVTLVVAKIIKFLIKRGVKKASEKLKVDPARYSFIFHTITALIYLVGFGFAVYTVQPLRNIGLSIFAGAGVIAVIIGFASQQAFSNIVAGVFIVIFKPFVVGQKIKINTHTFGTVEDITLRHTVIRNFENKRVIIPNTVISNETIENWDAKDKKICRWVEIGISYDANIDKAIKIIQNLAEKHPLFLDNRTAQDKKENHPAVSVRVIGFGDSSVNLRAYVWAKDPADAFVLGTDLNKQIKQEFDKKGVEIPFPYRTIVYKKDLK